MARVEFLSDRSIEFLNWIKEGERVMRIEKPKWAIGLTVLFAFVLTFGYGLQASAQENVPTEDELIAEAMERSFEEEITVTGSLIPRPT